MSPTQRIADRFIISDLEQDLLGRGGMGEVYRATDAHTREPVAVKALDPRVVVRDPDILERFVREGEALRQLDHPNIVRMIAAVEDGDRHYLVMEYVAGGSLHDLLEAQRPDRSRRPVRSLPTPRVVEIALDLADALTRAHRLGIIHRDLKPANVLLAEDGTPRLTDFGIARVADSPRLTQTGILMGTVDYLSPEACEGETLDERADIWSFGVMLYEMLSGERPFGGKSLSATLTAILTQPVPDLGERCPDAPDALVDLVYRMLEKDRGQRIPSVRLVGAELEAILKGRAVPTPPRLAPGASRFSGESRFLTPTPPAAALTQPQVAHNLPAQLTSFVGRERETAEAVHLLGMTRLLTLTGPPGTGKTRLSLQVAAKVLGQFQDGVFFVDLAPIRDPGLVATTIAQVLGIGESGGQPLLDTLKNALRHKHLLLLLDNFEQVVDAAPLVGELLSTSPGLKALVTSREALRVYGEQEYPVPPLTLPALDRAEPLRSLSEYEAIELFTRRARAVRPDFTLTEDNAPAVAEICVRLDGLPLAIELAAARSTILSPEMMRRRLESRLGVLVAGPRDLPARQRTLRGTIDWSYDLLEPQERTLFARLAVFQGGRAVEAVEAVCSHGLAIGILEGLESLLNKNLLRRIEGTAEEPRFVMLEMIHEYAWERLEASGEAEDLQRRHAEYFLALAERVAPEIRGSRYVYWSALLRDEHNNLRTALAWLLGAGEAELGLQLAGALRDFWFYEGRTAEGLAWTERALERAKDAPQALRARALNTAGLMCYDQADHKRGERYNQEALALFRELGDDIGTAWALGFQGVQALASPAECKKGLRLLEESLALFRKLDYKPGITQVLIGLGEVAHLDGDRERAARAYEECRAIAREEGDRMSEAKALGNLSYVAQQKGEGARAAELLTGALTLFQELGARRYICQDFARLAGPVAAQGYPQAAARLLGASEALLETIGIGLQAGDRHDIKRYVVAVREKLDEATFDAAWAEGRAMSFEQAFSYALEWGELAAAAPPPAPAREPEVAAEPPAFLEGEVDTVPSPVFVARERELAHLGRNLDRALSGQGRIVFVTGEAGQGKTALVAEFARRAQADHPDLIVAGGNCNAYTGIGDPYLPFREILGLLTGDVEAQWTARAIPGEQARRLWHALPLTVQALVEAGPDLIDVFVPGTDVAGRAAACTAWPERATWLPRLEQLVERKETILAAGDLKQTALFEQYTRVLWALARQRPLLLTLDDLQWADGGSLSLLFHLGRRIAGCRILILGAYRPAEVALGRGEDRHPLEAVVNECKRQLGDIEVDLHQVEGRQFVDAFLDTEPNRLGEGFRRILHQQTEGHPLATVELLRDMQERGSLVRDKEGQWVEGSALDWEAMPTRVEAVIAERIGRLPEPVREVLRVASVQGEVFIAEVVARVLEADDREMMRWLSKVDREHRLVSAQGIQRMNGQRLSVYRFRHILFQKYLYNNLDEVERECLHETVGTALEALYRERAEEIAVQLARHFQEGGIPEKAITYLLKAGNRAQRQYANEEAEQLYWAAVRILKDQGRTELAARTLMKLGLVYMAAFRPEKAQQVYDEAFTLWKPLRGGKELPTCPFPPAVLRVAVGEPVSLDPAKAYDSDSFFLQTQLFEGLVEIDTDQNVLPATARRWEVAEGGIKYTFYLEEKARWSDGTPLIADHFEYAWKRNLSPATNAPAAHLLYDIQNARAYREGEINDPGLVGVKALDDHTLEIRLERPKAYLPYLLAHPIAYPLPRWVVEAHQQAWTAPGHAVINGAYKVEEWQPGERLVLTRNPYYNGHFPGNGERVECLVFTEYGRALEAYATHTVDVVGLSTAAAEVMAQAWAAHREELIFMPMLNTNYLIFRTDRPPFDDVRVRKAFIHAVNREALIRRLPHGGHLPATGGFVPPEMPGHSPDIGLAHDPEAACRMLADAGYPGAHGLPTITWLHTHGLSDRSIIPLLREAWRQNFDLTVEVTTLAWEPFLARLEKNPPHLMLGGWIADYPDPDNFLRVVFHSSEGINEPHWHNDRFDTLVDEAARTTDPALRMALYHEADLVLVAEEAVIMPFSYGREPILLKPWVTHFSRQAAYSRHLKNIVVEEKRRVTQGESE